VKIQDAAADRVAMVENQLRRRGVIDARVLQAIARIPRELFVSERYRAQAYDDAPIPIGFDQTISQPYMTAFMVQALGLTGSENVLDVGTGSGYHAAVLGALARWVYSIEFIPELGDLAESNLRAAGLDGNITVIRGDGSQGYAEAMPYDAISVAAAAPEVPAPLIAQLADPGKLVIPVGTREEQDLLIVMKSGGQILRRRVAACRFVPLRGSEGWQD
jgi:protein-L-isoaspartate(D-aspartate) O-methyltransferase